LLLSSSSLLSGCVPAPPLLDLSFATVGEPMCKGAGRAGRPSTPYWGHQLPHSHAHGIPPHFVITPACWIGHGPPTQKDESQVVWGSNKSAFSNVDPCALPRANGPRSRHPRWPSHAHRPIWRGFTPRSQIRRTNSFAMPTNEVLRRGGEGRCCCAMAEGGALHGAAWGLPSPQRQPSRPLTGPNIRPRAHHRPLVPRY
jgi:hypothetical protein